MCCVCIGKRSRTPGDLTLLSEHLGTPDFLSELWLSSLSLSIGAGMPWESAVSRGRGPTFRGCFVGALHALSAVDPHSHLGQGTITVPILWERQWRHRV